MFKSKKGSDITLMDCLGQELDGDRVNPSGPNNPLSDIQYLDYL